MASTHSPSTCGSTTLQSHYSPATATPLSPRLLRIAAHGSHHLPSHLPAVITPACCVLLWPHTLSATPVCLPAVQAQVQAQLSALGGQAGQSKGGSKERDADRRVTGSKLTAAGGAKGQGAGAAPCPISSSSSNPAWPATSVASFNKRHRIAIPMSPQLQRCVWVGGGGVGSWAPISPQLQVCVCVCGG